LPYADNANKIAMLKKQIKPNWSLRYIYKGALQVPALLLFLFLGLLFTLLLCLA
jgi:hypothetical protein